MNAANQKRTSDSFIPATAVRLRHSTGREFQVSFLTAPPGRTPPIPRDDPSVIAYDPSYFKNADGSTYRRVWRELNYTPVRPVLAPSLPAETISEKKFNAMNEESRAEFQNKRRIDAALRLGLRAAFGG